MGYTQQRLFLCWVFLLSSPSPSPAEAGYGGQSPQIALRRRAARQKDYCGQSPQIALRRRTARQMGYTQQRSFLCWVFLLSFCSPSPAEAGYGGQSPQIALRWRAARQMDYGGQSPQIVPWFNVQQSFVLCWIF
jgi:hypothetical protein